MKSDGCGVENVIDLNINKSYYIRKTNTNEKELLNGFVNKLIEMYIIAEIATFTKT